MKKKWMQAAAVVMTAVFLWILAVPSPVKAADVPIDETNFPDEYFRAYVLEYVDEDEDGVLSAEEAAGVTELSFMYVEDDLDDSNPMISSFQGIEFFPNLEDLDCSYNAIDELDVSKNTALVFLTCPGCGLTKLDVSKNTKLVELGCYDNSLSTIDVSACLDLETLICSNTDLTALDVSKNTKLDTLYCDNNDLEKLDISQNKELTALTCYNNHIKSLDLSNNPDLSDLDCHDNLIDLLDIHGSTALAAAYKEGKKTEETDAETGTKYYYYAKDDDFATLAIDKNTKVLAEVLKITKQPEKQSVKIGEKASFSVTAQGSGLTYQWQWRAGADNTWADVDSKTTGYNTDTLTVTAAKGMSGYQYRCKITDVSGKSVTSNSASLNLTTVYISSGKIKPIADQTYTGSAITPEITVLLGSQTLVKDTDYTVEYGRNIDAGIAVVTVKGTGNYSGQLVANFNILPKPVKGLTVTGIKTMTYTGAKLEQKKLTVKDGTYTLIKGADYKAVYKKNIKAGKAKIVIKGLGNYGGKVNKYFTIKPPKTKILSAKNTAKGKVTLKWTAAKSGKGYEIQYGLKKNFKDAKTVDITKLKTKTKKISKLKKGKTYYFRIRVYVKVSGKKVYSKWSKKTKVKIKK